MPRKTKQNAIPASIAVSTKNEWREKDKDTDCINVVQTELEVVVPEPNLAVYLAAAFIASGQVRIK